MYVRTYPMQMVVENPKRLKGKMKRIFLKKLKQTILIFFFFLFTFPNRCYSNIRNKQKHMSSKTRAGGKIKKNKK